MKDQQQTKTGTVARLALATSGGEDKHLWFFRVMFIFALFALGGGITLGQAFGFVPTGPVGPEGQCVTGELGKRCLEFGWTHPLTIIKMGSLLVATLAMIPSAVMSAWDFILGVLDAARSVLSRRERS